MPSVGSCGQVGGLVSFPAYNVAVGFWGLYSTHTKDHTAVCT
jgi:hypothetical protein